MEKYLEQNTPERKPSLNTDDISEVVDFARHYAESAILTSQALFRLEQIATQMDNPASDPAFVAAWNEVVGIVDIAKTINHVLG